MGLMNLVAQLKIDRTRIGYKSGITDADTGLQYVLDTIYLWAGILAVFVLVIAGLLFVTSRGDASQMKRSKDAIRAAVIGLVVVMVAFVITRFVIGGLQG